MKKKIDFIIADNKYSKKIFRFYPKNSHVHGFNNDNPKTWEEVYKVYFAFSILEYDKNTNKCIEMYVEKFDECSCIDSVAYFIANMDSYGDSAIERCSPSGDGTHWIIEKFTIETYESMCDYCDEVEYESYYDFFLWHSHNGLGYHFQLSENKAIEFTQVIDDYLAYMLSHSECI